MIYQIQMTVQHLVLIFPHHLRAGKSSFGKTLPAAWSWIPQVHRTITQRTSRKSLRNFIASVASVSQKIGTWVLRNVFCWLFSLWELLRYVALNRCFCRQSEMARVARLPEVIALKSNSSLRCRWSNTRGKGASFARQNWVAKSFRTEVQ